MHFIFFVVGSCDTIFDNIFLLNTCSLVVLVLIASIDRERLSAFALPTTLVTHTKEPVLYRRCAALTTKTVALMKTVSSRESVFAHHHTSVTQKMATNARVLASGLPAVSTVNVHPPTHLNACVSPVILATLQ